MSRELTYDERKAAEAAFQGLPFNPKWSHAARAVYDGILAQLSQGNGITAPSIEDQAVAGDVSEVNEASSIDSAARESIEHDDQSAASSEMSDTEMANGDEVTADTPLASREDAMRAGFLIDVTSQARQVGLQVPVGISKAISDVLISASLTLPEEECESRLRDVLMALRLYLVATKVNFPLIEFPVLLSFPPDTVPQVCTLNAVVHEEGGGQYSLLVLLPNEVSITRSSPN